MEGKRRESGEKEKTSEDIYCEVLHRVLYPNTHRNGTGKKKARKPVRYQDRGVMVT
jgi:hypothetical protein